MTTLERMQPEQTAGGPSGWFDCPECGIDAELAAEEPPSWAAPCPDCGGGMRSRD